MDNACHTLSYICMRYALYFMVFSFEPKGPDHLMYSKARRKKFDVPLSARKFSYGPTHKTHAEPGFWGAHETWLRLGPAFDWL